VCFASVHRGDKWSEHQVDNAKTRFTSAANYFSS